MPNLTPAQWYVLAGVCYGLFVMFTDEDREDDLKDAVGELFVWLLIIAAFPIAILGRIVLFCKKSWRAALIRKVRGED